MKKIYYGLLLLLWLLTTSIVIIIIFPILILDIVDLKEDWFNLSQTLIEKIN